MHSMPDLPQFAVDREQRAKVSVTVCCHLAARGHEVALAYNRRKLWMSGAAGVTSMKLTIVQAGDPVLRKQSRPLTRDEIVSPSIQILIEVMRDTMREAPGVGLAAPQIGESIQLAVIEDRVEYMKDASAEQLAARQRSPVPFQV